MITLCESSVVGEVLILKRSVLIVTVEVKELILMVVVIVVVVEGV